MFKSVAKLAVTSYLWRRYQGQLKPLAIFLGGFLLISLLHGEYLSYVEASGNNNFVGFSFFIKWVLVGLMAVFYILAPIRAVQQDDKPPPVPDLAVPPKRKTPADIPGDDPFDALRSKKTLRSRADIVVEEHKPRDSHPS